MSLSREDLPSMCKGFSLTPRFVCTTRELTMVTSSTHTLSIYRAKEPYIRHGTALHPQHSLHTDLIILQVGSQLRESRYLSHCFGKVGQRFKHRPVCSQKSLPTNSGLKHSVIGRNILLHMILLSGLKNFKHY